MTGQGGPADQVPDQLDRDRDHDLAQLARDRCLQGHQRHRGGFTGRRLSSISRHRSRACSAASMSASTRAWVAAAIAARSRRHITCNPAARPATLPRAGRARRATGHASLTFPYRALTVYPPGMWRGPISRAGTRLPRCGCHDRSHCPNTGRDDPRHYRPSPCEVEIAASTRRVTGTILRGRPPAPSLRGQARSAA